MSKLPAKIGTISKKTRSVLDAIIEYKAANDGNSPSLNDIGDMLSLAPDTVRWHINKLVQAGVIERTSPTRNFAVRGATWSAPDYYTNPLTVDRRPLEYMIDRDERCHRCGRPAEDSGSARLRDGLCSACYHYRLRKGRKRPGDLYQMEAPFGWCLCGNGATVIVHTAVGEIALCARCARTELEDV